MNVFGIDGALGGFSCALLRDQQPPATQERPGNVALEAGLGAIAELFERTGLSPAQLDRIGVGIGPGGFTGLRIAIAYAKSLAQAWRVPLAGVSSFDALECHVANATPLLTVVRGRAGVISVRLRTAAAVRRQSGYVGAVLDALLPDLQPKPLHVLGAPEDVLAALGERGISVIRIDRVVSPAALGVAAVAAQREPAPSPHELRADYGELPAAKVPSF